MTDVQVAQHAISNLCTDFHLLALGIAVARPGPRIQVLGKMTTGSLPCSAVAQRPLLGKDHGLFTLQEPIFCALQAQPVICRALVT